MEEYRENKKKETVFSRCRWNECRVLLLCKLIWRSIQFDDSNIGFSSMLCIWTDRHNGLSGQTSAWVKPVVVASGHSDDTYFSTTVNEEKLYWHRLPPWITENETSFRRHNIGRDLTSEEPNLSTLAVNKELQMLFQLKGRIREKCSKSK